MWYKLSKERSEEILEMVNKNYHIPENSICTQYTDLIRMEDFDYLTKDEFTEQITFEYIEIVTEIITNQINL